MIISEFQEAIDYISKKNDQMMKKKYFIVAAAVTALVGCADQQLTSETLTDKVSEEKTAVSGISSTESRVGILMEMARWGDGKACLKLADCYRDGKGVEKDFMGMLGMAAQAEEFGGIDNMEDYLKEMPEGSDFKLLVDAIEKFKDNQPEIAASMAEQLIARGSADGYTVQGIMAMEHGDSLAGSQLLEQAASQGSTLAELLLCFPEWHGSKKYDMEKLTALSDKVPFVNTILAKMYLGWDDESMKDEQLVAHYFLKADEKACLNKRGARWLLDFHGKGNQLPLSGRDIQRLRVIAQEEVEIVDTVEAE